MFNKKLVFLMILISIFFLLTGCSNSDNTTTLDESDDNKVVDQLHISFKSNVTDETKISSQALKEELYSFDSNLYAEPFNSYGTKNQEELLGKKLYTVTPERFLAGIPRIRLHNTNGNLPMINQNFVHSTDTSGFAIVPMMDLVYSKNIINNDILLNSSASRFKEIELVIGADDFMFIPKSSWNGESAPNIRETFKTYSEIHIELPEEYSGIILDNEKLPSDRIYEPANNNIHVFSLIDLIPLENTDSHSVLIYFSEEIKEAKIYNPDGKRVEDFNPHLFESDRSTSWDGYFVYLPGNELNFSGGNKELSFIWDLSNLIEVYSNGTTEIDDDLVTLKLDNPFPIRFDFNSYSEVNHDSSSPEEVSFFEAKYFDKSIEEVMDNQIILRWINPNQKSFEKVILVRKLNSSPENINDGKQVYKGNFPIYFDKEIASNKEYFYKIFVENSTGRLSDGKTLNIITK